MTVKSDPYLPTTSDFPADGMVSVPDNYIDGLLDSILSLYGIGPLGKVEIINKIHTNTKVVEKPLEGEFQYNALKDIQMSIENHLVWMEETLFPIIRVQSYIRMWNTQRNLELVSLLRNNHHWISLLNSERMYMKQILSVVDYYQHPLLKFAIQNSSRYPPTLHTDIRFIFKYFSEILMVTKITLEKFEQIQSTYPLLFTIGLSFINLSPGFGIYIRYNKKLPVKLQLLNKIRLENPDLEEFIKNQQLQSPFPHISFTDLILLPVNQLAKYEESLSGVLRDIHHTLLWSSDDLSEFQSNGSMSPMKTCRSTSSLSGSPITEFSQKNSKEEIPKRLESVFQTESTAHLQSSFTGFKEESFDSTISPPNPFRNSMSQNRKVTRGIQRSKSNHSEEPSLVREDSSTSKFKTNTEKFRKKIKRGSEVTLPRDIKHHKSKDSEVQVSSPRGSSDKPKLVDLSEALRNSKSDFDRPTKETKSKILDRVVSPRLPTDTPTDNKNHVSYSYTIRGQKGKVAKERSLSLHSLKAFGSMTIRTKDDRRRLYKSTYMNEEDIKHRKIDLNELESKFNELKTKAKGSNNGLLEENLSEPVLDYLHSLWTAYQALKHHNQLIQEAISKERSSVIYHSITGQDAEVILRSPHRQLIHSGYVLTKKRQARKEKRYFLFTDVLLLTEPTKNQQTKKWVLKDTIFLKQVERYSELTEQGDICTFEIQVNGANKSYPILFTISKQDIAFYDVLRERTDASGKLFGVSLETLMLRPDTINGIPAIVVETTKNLLDRGKKEGIFRVSANTIHIQSLREKLNSGETCDFSQVDIHTLSNILKLFLRELPEPVITFGLYNPLIELAVQMNKGEDKDFYTPLLKSLLDQLPTAHYNLLFYLVKFLNEMSTFSDLTKMGIDNLAIIFAANILRPENDTPELSSSALPYSISIVRTIIKNVDELYEDKSSAAKNIPVEDKWISDLSQLLDEVKTPRGSITPKILRTSSSPAKIKARQSVEI